MRKAHSEYLFASLLLPARRPTENNLPILNHVASLIKTNKHKNAFFVSLILFGIKSLPIFAGRIFASVIIAPVLRFATFSLFPLETSQ